MYGFTIHINLKKKTNLDFSLKNQQQITFKNYYFNYLKFNKFENDKIFSENNEYIIGIDGVILNLKDLKNKYAISNYFKLITHLFKKENINFVNNLKGEYSGFIFCKKTETLFYFNNKTATKQVFYSKFNDFLMISPSIKNIINFKASLNLKNHLNQNATYNLLTFGGMIENDTLIEDVFKLNAGQYIKVENEYFNVVNYATFNNIDYSIDNKKEAISKINETFTKALKLEYEKDIEYNYKHLATLSGGLDSRMNVMVAHKLGYLNKTFCFSQSDYLDEKIAREIANDLKLDFQFIPLDRGEYLTSLSEMVTINNGLQFFLGSAHFNYSLKKLDLTNFGLIHTGQIGDGVLGSFVTKNNEITSKLVSNKLSGKINIDSKTTSKYANEEVYKLYQRVFNLTNFGSYTVESHQTYLVSPFLDDDFINVALSINPKLKYKQQIYLDWIKEYHPKTTKYKWERTGFKPNKNWKTSLSKYTKKIKKEYYNFSNQKEKFTMTPTEFWFKKSQFIQNKYHDVFNTSIYLIESNNLLFNDLNKLFNEGNTIEKSMVLTVLEIVKKFNLKV